MFFSLFYFLTALLGMYSYCGKKAETVSLPFISVEVFLDNMQFKFYHTHEKIKVLDQIPAQSGILELPTSSSLLL